LWIEDLDHQAFGVHMHPAPAALGGDHVRLADRVAVPDLAAERLGERLAGRVGERDPEGPDQRDAQFEAGLGEQIGEVEQPGWVADQAVGAEGDAATGHREPLAGGRVVEEAELGGPAEARADHGVLAPASGALEEGQQ
jgi:hypothetical protein